MNQKIQGVIRPLVQGSSCIMLALLLSGPASFAQQEKPLNLSKNQSVDDANERIAQLALAAQEYVTANPNEATIATVRTTESRRPILVLRSFEGARDRWISCVQGIPRAWISVTTLLASVQRR